MTQQNHRKNVWITPETHAQLIAIGRAHGAAKGREVSPGIRVAAGYHERLVEALRECAIQIDDERPTSRCMDNIASDAAWKILTELDNLENAK